MLRGRIGSLRMRRLVRQAQMRLGTEGRGALSLPRRHMGTCLALALPRQEDVRREIPTQSPTSCPQPRSFWGKPA